MKKLLPLDGGTRYYPPLLDFIEIDVQKPFAVSHVTTVENNVSVDDWGSSNNEVSFD